ncbi:metallophosphoesterase [Streptomyces spinosirectus]|jgi:predicted phosphodiesterase|uniref:metallophosphoesterase family protein n=1 Tax=Streptomyces TaxID=1883 RepID=UPI001C9DEE0B|nr:MULTISPECIES: metallophosphoesterase [Streptomyces]MBY8344431.1 metallophosphoesterase [Streptomyces plumbidurans]UIR19497.1 metallophosphoesterase [Streptomyces spinosirectus]
MARVPAAVTALNRIRRAPRALTRHPRNRRRPQPALELTPQHPPWLRALSLVAVVLLGAWLGLLIVGNVRVPVGPVNTTMTLRPSLTGGTKINVSPLGALQLNSHHAPVRLDVNIDQLDPERAQALVDHPERLTGLQHEVTHDIEHGTLDLALRSCIAVVSGATALGLAVYRRPRQALTAGATALTLLIASGATAWATWNPESVLEPKYSGLLSSAPSLVGNARNIVTEFDVYQKELARLVTNVTKLYDVTSTLPAYQPDPTTVRVLHVSDIHLNPASWKIIASLVQQYKVNVIVDTGDTMDHGTAAENGFLDPIADLGTPYIWVRGNHDSDLTQRYLTHMKNVHVLDNGHAETVAGLRFAGIGDPQFTPDRSNAPGADQSEQLAGDRLASALRDQKNARTPVDIAMAHEPSAAREVDGDVPLVLCGHLHHEGDEILKYGTRLRMEGSTGGSGLRALEHTYPAPVEASILYFDRDTRLLQAWDSIKLGGLGETTAEVTRHLPKENQPGATPSPATTSTPPSVSSSPSVSTSP